MVSIKLKASLEQVVRMGKTICSYLIGQIPNSMNSPLNILLTFMENDCSAAYFQFSCDSTIMFS